MSEKIKKILLPLFTFLFITGFVNNHTPSSGWYKQTVDGLNGKTINDIIFLDSLNGYIVASKNVNPDTAAILKTTNGGETWQIILNQSQRRFTKIGFIDNLKGYICGGSGSGTPYIYKTTDGGNNWVQMPVTTGNSIWNDMSIIDEDTIFVVDQNSLNGGVYRTTNGGLNWTQQYSAGSQNPNKIYMYNSRIGFISRIIGFPFTNNLRKTTNGGENWFSVNNDGFLEMYFSDSLTGWKTTGLEDSSMKKTTDGGLTWKILPVTISGVTNSRSISSFSNINKDTIWAVGGGYIAYPNGQNRQVLYRTTNGGMNWYFQLPDTSLNVYVSKIRFTDKNNGWGYSSTSGKGIHTKVGGDSIFNLTSSGNISEILPSDYILSQNYPNPFNPETRIRFTVKKNRSEIRIRVFDIKGKEIKEIVNGVYTPGEYEVIFNATGLSSGTYFYTMTAGGYVIDTKKLLLLK